MPSLPAALTIFRGRCGDRNPYGMAGAERMGARLAEPQAPLAGDWRAELAAARPDLGRLADRLDRVMRAGLAPVTTMGRCAAALATLPVVARHCPDALVVWFDAHADCHAPETTTSGYLGGMVLSAAAGRWSSGLGVGLDLSSLVLVGARDIDPPEARLIAASGAVLVAPGPDLAARLAKALSGRPAYVHLDCDVLQPGLAPTEYRVDGGLSFADLREAMAALAATRPVGVEIAEFEDRWADDGRPASPDDLVAALEPLLASFTGAASPR